MLGALLLRNRVAHGDHGERPDGGRRIVRREGEFGPARRDEAVRDGHAARDPAEQTAAEVDDDGESVEELQHDLTPEHDEGHRDQETEDDQHRLVVVVRLLRRARDRDHVVEAHDEVRHDDRLDRAEELVAPGDVAVAFVLGDEELDADPKEERPAHDLEEREIEDENRGKV